MLLPIDSGLSGIIGNISLLNYVALAYVVFILVENIHHKYLFTNKEYWGIFAFMAYSLLSCMWSDYLKLNYYFFTFVFSFVILSLATSRLYHYEEIILMKRIFLLSSFTLIIATVLNLNNTYGSRLIIKVTSEMDPNIFGCGACIIFAVLLVEYDKTKNKLLLLMIPIIIGIVVLTGSRGALLMCAFEMFAGVILKVHSNYRIYRIKVYRKKIIEGIVIALVLVLVLFGFYFLFSYELSDELLNRFTIESVLSSGGSGRISIWKAAIDKFFNSDFVHMLFGYGHGSFSDIVNFYLSTGKKPSMSHNIFLNSLIEKGIIGIVLMIIAFYQGLRKSRQNQNYIGYISLFGLATAGLSLDVQSYRVFPMVFFVAIVFDNKERLLVSKKTKPNNL